MTNNERYQIVSRIRKMMEDAKEAGKIEKAEYRAVYELGELRADLRELCRDIEFERFPVESEVKNIGQSDTAICQPTRATN